MSGRLTELANTRLDAAMIAFNPSTNSEQ